MHRARRPARKSPRHDLQKGLKLRVVEKENFIDSLVQREDLLQSDVNKDKQALSNLKAHITAMRARIEKLKKTKQKL